MAVYTAAGSPVHDLSIFAELLPQMRQPTKLDKLCQDSETHMFLFFLPISGIMNF